MKNTTIFVLTISLIISLSLGALASTQVSEDFTVDISQVVAINKADTNNDTNGNMNNNVTIDQSFLEENNPTKSLGTLGLQVFAVSDWEVTATASGANNTWRSLIEVYEPESDSWVDIPDANVIKSGSNNIGTNNGQFNAPLQLNFNQNFDWANYGENTMTVNFTVSDPTT